MDVFEVLDADPCVLVVYRVHAYGRLSGIPVERDVVNGSVRAVSPSASPAPTPSPTSGDTGPSMSQILETLRSSYEAMSRGDWDAAFDAADPDFELVPPSQSPDPAPLKGADQARAWLADQEEMVGGLSIEVEKLIEAEKFIVALVRARIRPHAADTDFELRIAHLWTVSDRKLMRCQIFPERARALEAAGLSE